MTEDDIPELTGAKRDAIRAQSQDAGAFLLNYAKHLRVDRTISTDTEFFEFNQLGRMLETAVKCLVGIAERGDCACPEACRRALLAMAEVIE